MAQLIQPSKLVNDLSEKNFDFNMLNNVSNLFNAAFAVGLWHHVASLLTDRSLYLPDLSVEAKRFTGNRHHLGTQSVAIRGSIGRSTDFDTHFNPLRAHLRDRWIGVAVARERESPLPPVELIRFGKCYFVQDGHHRISVALARGETYIDAEVTASDVIGDFSFIIEELITDDSTIAGRVGWLYRLRGESLVSPDPKRLVTAGIIHQS